MRKLLVSLLLSVIALGASAEFRWGPTVGLNISELYWNQNHLLSTKLKPGGNVGLMGEIMIPGIGFGIDMGVKYALHGAKVNFGEHEIWKIDGYGNEDVWFHTIQIPVNLRFKWTRMNGLEQYVAPFAFAGPVFSFNVATNKVSCLEYPTGSVGVQCGIGGEFLEKYQLSFGYLWGITYDAKTVKLDNLNARQRGWQINIAMLF